MSTKPDLGAAMEPCYCFHLNFSHRSTMEDVFKLLRIVPMAGANL
jgi:hypothetical protein